MVDICRSPPGTPGRDEPPSRRPAPASPRAARRVTGQPVMQPRWPSRAPSSIPPPAPPDALTEQTCRTLTAPRQPGLPPTGPTRGRGRPRQRPHPRHRLGAPASTGRTLIAARRSSTPGWLLPRSPTHRRSRLSADQARAGNLRWLHSVSRMTASGAVDAEPTGPILRSRGSAHILTARAAPQVAWRSRPCH
jgi:hypothetical protein